MKKLLIIKLCNCCGKTYEYLPPSCKVWVDDEALLGPDIKILGYDYQCQCGSNIFFKVTNVLEEAS